MARRIPSTLVTTGLLVLASAGCPGKLAADTGEVCKRYVAAVAAYAQRCEVPGDSAYGDARAEEACVKELAAPGATNLAAARDRCAAEISAAACGDRIECNEERVTGDLDDGAACAAGFQCKSGLCRRDGIGSCGVCVPRNARSAAGGPCVDSADCVEGAECSISTDGGRCVAIDTADAGEPCGSTREARIGCAKGLRCFDARRDESLGTCRPPAGLGGECRGITDCADDLTCIGERCVERLPEGAPCAVSDRSPCARGLACDGTCEKIVLAHDGGACDQYTRLCERGSCIGVSGPSNAPGEGPLPGRPSDHVTPGVCVERAGEGAPCDGPSACRLPASCIAGRCTTLDPGRCR